MRAALARTSGLEVVRQLPILDVANRLGIRVRGGRSARCPFPDHTDTNPSFAFYPGTNTCWCHGCGRGGDVINLVALRQGWTSGEAIRWLRQTYGLGLKARRGIGLPHLPRPKAVTAAATQASPYARFAPNEEIYAALLEAHPMEKLGSDYLKLRGFSRATVAHFRLGFLNDAQAAAAELIERFGRDAVYRAGLLNHGGSGAKFLLPSPSVLFPFLEGTRITYVQTRILPGVEGPRWMGPQGIAKPVYNIDIIAKSRSIYVCEGATDVVSAHELKLAAIGLLGGASRLPVAVLSALKGRTVYIVPDADDVGDRMSAKVISDLQARGIDSAIKHLPMGKDINEFLLMSRHPK